MQRGRDSNPRYGFPHTTLSRRAPSTTRTPLCIFLRTAKVMFTPQLPNIFWALAVVIAPTSSSVTFFISASFLATSII